MSDKFMHAAYHSSLITLFPQSLDEGLQVVGQLHLERQCRAADRVVDGQFGGVQCQPRRSAAIDSTIDSATYAALCGIIPARFILLSLVM